MHMRAQPAPLQANTTSRAEQPPWPPKIPPPCHTPLPWPRVMPRWQPARPSAAVPAPREQRLAQREWAPSTRLEGASRRSRASQRPPGMHEQPAEAQHTADISRGARRGPAKPQLPSGASDARSHLNCTRRRLRGHWLHPAGRGLESLVTAHARGGAGSGGGPRRVALVAHVRHESRGVLLLSTGCAERSRRRLLNAATTPHQPLSGLPRRRRPPGHRPRPLSPTPPSPWSPAAPLPRAVRALPGVRVPHRPLPHCARG